MNRALAKIARDALLLMAETEDHTAVAVEVNPREGAAPQAATWLMRRGQE
jgi:hypothetical protein